MTEQAQSQLTLEIWHPDCWTLTVTESNPGGILAHSVYNTNSDRVRGHFTVYGNSPATVAEMVAEIDASPLTASVHKMHRRHGFQAVSPRANSSTELFVEYDPANSMSEILLNRDFIQAAPVRIFNGREYWSLFINESRAEINSHLDDITADSPIEITITQISNTDFGGIEQVHRKQQLTDRQLEVFELAQRRNYYSWPREVSTRELADEIGLSKTTLLEHLRRAEAKLLAPDP